MKVSRDDTETLFLARALTGARSWPPEAKPEDVVKQALYHGIAGELILYTSDWPADVAQPLRRAAVSQAMWELRHKRVLEDLLSAFSAAGVKVLLLKGSALAYDLYTEPAHRSRGDTDLLVSRADLTAAREILSAHEFLPLVDDPTVREAVALEEHWQRKTLDGFSHEIDLHWQTLNSVALAHVVPFEVAWKRALPLPRLSPGAFGLPRDLALLLACAHRAKHVFSPYFVEGKTYLSGDRLIWLRDIDLLARALDPEGWAAFERAVLDAGLPVVTRSALDAAARYLETPIPQEILIRLSAAPRNGPADLYLLAPLQVERALQDIRALDSYRARVTFLWNRLLPGAEFMRTKYSHLAHLPLPFLYLRRVAEFLRPRWKRGN